MKTKAILSTLIVLCILVGLCAIGVAVVGAQSTPCPPVALVGGLATPYANVRQTPAIGSAQINRIFPGDTPAPADVGVRDGSLTWWHLCSGGYVRSDVVKVSTVTPSASPTRLSQAQTNIAQMTAVARTATAQPRVIIIEGENGVVEFTIICPVPCEFKGTTRQLP